MRRISILLLCLIILTVFCSTKSRKYPKLKPEEVKDRIKKSGLDFSKESFRKQLLKGDTRNVHLLLQAGMDPEAKLGSFEYENRNFPEEAAGLHLASIKGHDEIVELLIEAGANVNAQNKNFYDALMSPLMAASSMGHTKIVQLLIDAGAEVNAKFRDGTTPLMTASAVGQPEVAQLLINKGANLDARNDDGETALMKAAKRGNPDVTKLLIDAGADSEIEDDDGKTVLVKAIKSHPDLVKVLIEGGGTALTMHARRRNPDIVAALINAGAVADEKILNYALMSAATRGPMAARSGSAKAKSPETAKILINVGAQFSG